MILNSASTQLIKKLGKLVPDMEQLICAKFVNYLTMRVSTQDQSWSHWGNLLHEQHTQAIAYLQANFKNHIVNIKGLTDFYKTVQYLKQTDNEELQNQLCPNVKNTPFKDRKCFYIFDQESTLDQIMSNPIVKNKVYNKVVCFSKQKPIEMTKQLQQFCRQYKVRALGLKQFKIQSLTSQILKTSKRPTLIHELVTKDQSFYTNPVEKGVPAEIIFFNQNVKNTFKKQSFIELKQIARNYLFRNSFADNSRPTTTGFKVFRMQHLAQAEKYQEAIQLQDFAGTPQADED